MNHTRKTLLICILLNACFLSSQVNLTSSLTACYSLNGHANDAINSLNGTITGVATTTDRFNNAGSALSFSGTASSVVLLPNNSLLKPGNAVSVSGWFKVTSFINNALVVFVKNNFGSWFTAYALAVQNSGGYKFAAWRQNGSASDFVQGTSVISANTWYHVVFTIDNSTMRIYVNGQLENTISNTISSFNYDPGRGVVLGGTNEGNYNVPFNGCIDNLRFYSRVINSSEVYDLYTLDPACVPAAPLPVASFSMSTGKICQGGAVTFTDSSTNGPTSWTWTAPSGLSQNASTSAPTYTFNSPGVFTISLAVSSPAGTSTNTAVKSLTVYPRPAVTASASNTKVCEGDLVHFSANGAVSYLWMNQFPTKNYTSNVTASGTFSVTGTDANGCQNSASVFVKVDPLPAVTASVSDPAICAGGVITLNAAGAASYVWSTFHTTASFTLQPPASALYTVTGTDANGCVNTAVSSVTVNSLPVVTANASNTLVCPGEAVGLNAAGASTFMWSNNLPYAGIYVLVFTDTTFMVTGTDLNGCKNMATVTLMVRNDCDEVGIEEHDRSVWYYPNPVKDRFRIRTGSQEEYSIEIYNTEGKCLLAGKLGGLENTVDISSFAAGVYFLKIAGRTEKTILKLMKQ